MSRGGNNVIDMSKLYVIGNGFDLKHGIPSRYSDFARFVKSTDVETYLAMERFYPNLSIDGLWSNFEEALGMPDDKELIVDFNRLKGNRDDIIGVNKMTLDMSFRDWLNALSEYMSKYFFYEKKYVLDVEDSYFMSFNYTRTLEEKYNVPQKRVCYIHEVVPKDTAEKQLFAGYVYGHGKTSPTPNMDLYEGIQNPIQNDKIEQVYSDFYKYPQWDTYNDFFENLNNKEVSDIIVLGHSLAKVDHPYFFNIIGTFKHAKWHIGYFDEEDKIRKIYYCSELKINNPDLFHDK